MPADRPLRSRWWFQLTLVAAAGFVIRVGYILAFENPYVPAADALYYFAGGQVLAHGHGFINGIAFGMTNGRLSPPSAFHPPAYTVFLALPQLLGFKSVLDQQIATSMLGAATVVVVGLLARRIAGPRSGLIAAGFTAVYPNMWFSDVFLMSETLSLLAIAVALLLTYRCLARPNVANMVALGGVCGIASLSRAETVFLAPFVGLSILVLLRNVTWKRRWWLVSLVVLATGATIAPWVIYNHGRFERPVYLTTGFGNLLDTSNCDRTYSGPRLGSYYGYCQLARVPSEESQAEYMERKRAVNYISEHLDRFPIVALARVGRTWGLYRPLQVIRLDNIEPQEPRELPTAWIGLGMYYGLALTSLAGVVVLRRRCIPVLPLLVPILLVSMVAIATNGQTRYRASAEVSLVVLSAVAIGRPRRPGARAEAASQLNGDGREPNGSWAGGS